MSQELGEAMQIVRTGIDGVPVVIKGTYTAIKDFLKFLHFIYSKTPKGKNKDRLKELMSMPGQKQFLTASDDDIAKIANTLDKMGAKYYLVPDMIPEDGKMTIMYDESDINIISKAAEGIKTETHKSYEEYKKVYGANWTEEMEAAFRETTEIPTVKVAEIVNNAGSLTPEELRAELLKDAEYSDKQIGLGIEAAMKDELIVQDSNGNYKTVENFNGTLDKHLEDSALWRGRALKEDERFTNLNITKSMQISEAEISKWELPKTDHETGMHLVYYKIPGSFSGSEKNPDRGEVIGIPKEHVCGVLNPGTKNQANEVFIGREKKYKIYDISRKKTDRERFMTGELIKRDLFTNIVKDQSGVSKEHTKDHSKDHKVKMDR